MKISKGLILAVCGLVAPGMAAALELRIDGVPIDGIEAQGLGTVTPQVTKAGTRWLISLQGQQVEVLEGRELVAQHLRNELAAQTRHAPDDRATQRKREVLVALEQQAAQQKTTYTQPFCTGSLNFTPSFRRSAWYGRSYSDVAYYGTGPGAGAVTIWALADAIGQSSSDSDSQSYNMGSQQSAMVSAAAVAGPEPTANISLSSGGGMTGACGAYWFPTITN